MTALITFRESVSESDTALVHDIVSSTGFFTNEEIAIAAELVIEYLEKGPRSGYNFIFALAEGRTVGYTCFGPIAGTLASYDLYWIAVHAAQRRGGIGRELMRETEKAILAQGGDRIYIDTSSKPQYEPTRGFYKACGYRLEAQLEDFYMPGDSKCIFAKQLKS